MSAYIRNVVPKASISRGHEDDQCDYRPPRPFFGSRRGEARTDRDNNLKSQLVLRRKI